MLIEKKYINLSTSLFFKLLINVFVVFYVAKNVSISDFGSFSLAFVLGTISTLILDFGFNLRSLVLTSKTKEEINEELTSMIFSKILITLLVLILTSIFICCLSSYNEKTNLLIIILVASSFPNSFGNFFLNNFKILGEYDKEAYGYIIQGMSLLILLFLNYIFGQANVINYAIILLLSKIFYFLYGLYIFRKHFFQFNIFKINKSIINKTLLSIKNATPYGIHLILGASIIYIDTFILSILSTMKSVGEYQAGMRIIMASMLIAVIINDAFIPDISGLINNKSLAAKKLSKLFEFLLLFSFLVIISLFFYKRTIILLLFSNDYINIENYVFYIISIVFLRYIGIVPGIILTSFDRQIIRAQAVILAIITSILLNILLIPLWNIEGAFFSSLIAHIVLNIIYIYFALKIVRFTKNTHIFYLIFLILLYIIIQKYFFKDSFLFLIVTIIINIFILFIYNKKLQRREI